MSLLSGFIASGTATSSGGVKFSIYLFIYLFVFLFICVCVLMLGDGCCVFVVCCVCVVCWCCGVCVWCCVVLSDEDVLC